MKKIGISILSLMLVCCFVFIGCSSANVLPVNEVERVKYTNATNLVLGDGVSLDGTVSEVTDYGHLIVNKEVDGKTHYGVFSVLENKLVYGFAENEITIESSEYGDYVVVKTVADDKTTYKIVDMSGNTLFDGISSYDLESKKFEKYAYESWTIDGADESKVVYLDKIRLKDGKRSEVFEYPLIKKGYVMNTSTTIKPAVLTLGEKAEKYMADIVTLSNGDMSATLYTHKGKVKANYVIETKNLESIVPFGSEYLLQYVNPVDILSDEYDFIIDGEKFDLVTYRLNGLTGKKKEVKFDYLCVEPQAHPSVDYVMAVVFDVMGQNIDSSNMEDYAKYARVYKNGDVETLDYIYEKVEKLSDDRYLAYTSTEVHVVDEEYNIVVNLGNVDKVYATSERLFVVDGQEIVLIDFDGVMISNTPAYKPAEIVGVVNDCLLVLDKPNNASNKEWKRITEAGEVVVVATLTDGVYKYGEVEVETIYVTETGIMVTKASQTTGNSVYELYGFDGTHAGTWDVATLTSLPTQVKFGGETGTAHLVVECGDIFILVY